jgi:hypothetical protein
MRPVRVRAGRGNGSFATIADEDRFAGLDLENGDEEQAQIVVHPLEVCLVQSAPGAAPGRLVQDLDPGLDAADEKEEAFDHKNPYYITLAPASRDQRRAVPYGGFVLDRQYDLVY